MKFICDLSDISSGSKQEFGGQINNGLSGEQEFNS